MVLLVLAVVFTLATLAASVFSSMVVDSGTLEVLVSSPYCGWATSERNTRHYASSPVKTVAVSYAGDCYRNTTTQRGCDVFTRSKVPLTTTNVSCPFGTLCPHESAVSVDSGLLDVGKTFGLNLPHKDQVQYRKLTTCQVLPVDGYTKVAPFEKFKQTMGRDALPNEEVMHIDFGGSILHSPTYAPTNITVVTGLTLANITRLYDQG
jgi:hypothetical protein